MKQRSFLAATAIALSLGLVLVACGGENPTPTPTDPSKPAPSAGFEGTVEGIKFTLPNLGNSVELHTPEQAAYLKQKAYAEINKYANGVNKDETHDHREISYPLPVTFTWRAEGAAADAEYTLSVSETERMDDAWEFSTAEMTVDVYNLKVGTTYYWTVSAGNVESGKAVFTTKSGGPRNLYVDGVANVRDLGGWQGANGPVRQGLLYRCGRLNANYSGEQTITEAGIAMMRDTLKIKTEIDLRGGSDDASEYGNKNESMLGSTVAYHHIGMNWNGNLFTLNKPQLKEVFSLLADPSNYPIIFHCSIGTDRTGIIAYMIGGLLGVAEADLCRDYLFSNFAYIEGARDLGTIRNTYINTINGFHGETFSEKVREAMLSLGLTEGQIDSIVTILG